MTTGKFFLAALQIILLTLGGFFLFCCCITSFVHIDDTPMAGIAILLVMLVLAALFLGVGLLAMRFRLWRFWLGLIMTIVGGMMVLTIGMGICWAYSMPQIFAQPGLEKLSAFYSNYVFGGIFNLGCLGIGIQLLRANERRVQPAAV